MTQKLFLGANWKMNEPPVGSCTEDSPYRATPNVDICVFPSFLDLHTTHIHGLVTGAQCGHPQDEGAFTGDVSMKMLANQRVSHVLCGHSDRRLHHGETDVFVAEQVVSALQSGIIPVLCLGETKEERAAGNVENVLRRQIDPVLKVFKKSPSLDQFIIAYEPVWAISHGDTSKSAAGAKDADALHAFIRSLLPDSLKKVRVIYGASMKVSNAKELLSQPNIDGGLIGAASLKPDEFRKIVEIAASLKKG